MPPQTARMPSKKLCHPEQSVGSSTTKAESKDLKYHVFLQGESQRIGPKPVLSKRHSCLTPFPPREVSRKSRAEDLPTCDITLKELEVILSAGISLASLSRGSNTSIEVEIYPFLDSLFTTGAPAERSAQQELQLQMTDNERNETSLERIARYVDQLRCEITRLNWEEKEGSRKKRRR